MCTCSKCMIPIFWVQFSKKYMISALSAEDSIAEHVGPYFLASPIGEIYCSVRYSMTMTMSISIHDLCHWLRQA